MKNKKEPKNKKNKCGRRPYHEVDQIEKLYKIINKIQLEDKAIYIYFIDQNLNSVAENIFKDAEIVFDKIESSRGLVFRLFPSKREDPDIDIDVDFFDDEIIEDGRVF